MLGIMLRNQTKISFSLYGGKPEDDAGRSGFAEQAQRFWGCFSCLYVRRIRAAVYGAGSWSKLTPGSGSSADFWFVTSICSLHLLRLLLHRLFLDHAEAVFIKHAGL
jgi:hypothetical protein